MSSGKAAPPPANHTDPARSHLCQSQAPRPLHRAAVISASSTHLEAGTIAGVTEIAAALMEAVVLLAPRPPPQCSQASCPPPRRGLLTFFYTNTAMWYGFIGRKSIESKTKNAQLLLAKLAGEHSLLVTIEKHLFARKHSSTIEGNMQHCSRNGYQFEPGVPFNLSFLFFYKEVKQK